MTLAGSFHYTAADARAALDLLARGEVPTERLVTAESPLERYAFVLERLSRGRGDEGGVPPVIPPTMKAALARAPGRIEIVEMETPRPGPGEVLVAMKAVGLCGSDVHPWYVATKAPAVLGHETAGVVVGDGRRRRAPPPGRPGLRPPPRARAAPAAACAAGEPVMCPEWKPSRLHPGGLAEFVRVAAPSVSRDTLLLPPHVSLHGRGVRGAGRLRAEGGGPGPRPRGRHGARRRPRLERHPPRAGSRGSPGRRLLVGSDPDPVRRRLARELGLRRRRRPGAGERRRVRCRAASADGADVVFVIPTAAAAVLSSIEAAAPAARVVFFSPVSPETVWPIAPHTPYFKDLTLRFSYSSGPLETRRALDLVASGALPVERLVTHRLPLERAAEAFALAEARRRGAEGRRRDLMATPKTRLDVLLVARGLAESRTRAEALDPRRAGEGEGGRAAEAGDAGRARTRRSRSRSRSTRGSRAAA